jgi:hypothetical protein
MEESSIDFPQPELCPAVWDKQDGTYTLKREVENKIYSILREYPHIKLLDLADEVHLIGSIGTNQYDEDSDIDVHLVIPDSKIPPAKSREDWQKDIKKWYKDNLESLDAFIGKHPIEVYYQLTPAQEMLADALYDVKNKKWLKGPKIVEVDFNPYSVYKNIIGEVGKIVGETDDLIGELKRDVIDYDVIKGGIEKAPLEVKEKLKAILQSKLDEVEKDIAELMANKKEWVDMRKYASTPASPEQALDDIELIKRWENTNALFKFISRYQYIKLITELENMMGKEMQIDDDDVRRIKKLLGVLATDAEYTPKEQL